MTARQIDAKYDRFIIEFSRDGVSTLSHVVEFRKFKDVKAQAIQGLTVQLDKAHGRGDHSVKVYGANLVNVTPIEKQNVGFGPQWEHERSEEVFSL